MRREELTKCLSRCRSRRSKDRWSRERKSWYMKHEIGTHWGSFACVPRQISWTPRRNILSQCRLSNFQCWDASDCGSRNNIDRKVMFLSADCVKFLARVSESVRACWCKCGRMKSRTRRKLIRKEQYCDVLGSYIVRRCNMMNRLTSREMWLYTHFMARSKIPVPSTLRWRSAARNHECTMHFMSPPT